MSIANLDPLPLSEDHRLSPLTTAIVAIALSAVVGALGFGMGTMRPVPMEQRSIEARANLQSPLLKAIIAADGDWAMKNAHCQWLEKDRDFGFGIDARVFCEAWVFNQMIQTLGEKR